MLTSNRSLQDLAASNDFLDTATDGREELPAERRASDDGDLAPIIGMIVAVSLSLPFWWALIVALL
jgi:hypothetical protein